ncbi:unnamed protein product, partial [Brassica rapa]
LVIASLLQQHLVPSTESINTISPCDECLAIREYLTGVRIK